MAKSIIVKYRAEGDHALEQCADRISSQRDRFARHSRDGSDSLDQIQQRFALGRQRAIFRAPSSEPLEVQRRTLRGRLERQRPSPRSARRAPTSGRRLPDLAHVYRIEIPEGVSRSELLDALSSDPHVEYAQPDHLRVLDQALPFDDPFLESIGSWGQPYPDLWGPERVGVVEIWPELQGEGAVVAIVDTGLDRFHPDIAANVWVNPGEDLDGDGLAEPEDANGLDDDGNGFVDDLTGFDFANSVDVDEDGFFDGPNDVSDPDPFDDHGHGTHVAGTIAAVADNGIGIVGIAPRAKVMALKGFPEEGPASDSILWRAVLYAAENGATVANNSWSCGSPCPDNPLADEVLEIVEALGMVVVTSAGNASDDVVFRSPENGRRVITVGATGVDDQPASFTNGGWLMDVVAPGGGPNTPTSVRLARRNILSLLSSGMRDSELPFAVGDDYLRLAGTSMSAPHVTAAVAILRSVRPDLEPAEVRRLIRMSARDLGAPGHDPDFAAGLLDVAALVDTLLPDIDFSVDSPRPGFTHDPAKGALVLRGRADGPDLAWLEVDVGFGLTARSFEPLASFGDSRLELDSADPEPGVLARWDVAEVADGPHVIRLRAHLLDGRVVEEYAIVGIERNAPIRLSEGLLDAAHPALSGRRLFWQVDESEDSKGTHDLAAGLFPRRVGADYGQEPRTRLLFEREGNQREVVADGRELAWLTNAGGVWRIERCRLDAQGRCAPSSVSDAEGTLLTPRVGGGWLVWMRFLGTDRILEGCRIGLDYPICQARPLLDPGAEPGWVLQSFDGRTLLLARGGTLARCSIDPDSSLCAPEEIAFPPGFSIPLEPVHDAGLLAFSRVTVERVRPPGCEPFDPRPQCTGELAVLVQYHACWLDAASVSCDPLAISGKVRIEQALGIDVSRRRVVWSMATEVERASLHSCEFQPLTHECVDQRILGAAAFQARPAIDRDRVVWEDGRAGEVAIWGLELPRISGPATRRHRVGRPFSIPLRVRPGTSGVVRYELEAIDGPAPEVAKAKVFDGGKPGGVVFLRGQWPRVFEGAARWRIRAVGGGGLYSEHVISLESLARPSRRPSNRPLRPGRPGLR